MSATPEERARILAAAKRQTREQRARRNIAAIRLVAAATPRRG